MKDLAVRLLQRSSGTGRLIARSTGRQTRLGELFQDGSAKIRLPRGRGDTGLEAILINTSGGLTGGDELTWDIDAAATADLTLTTQACEKVYRSTDDIARVDVRLRLGCDARLAWLPQETILFDGARLARTIDVDLEDGARLLAVESTIFGRSERREDVRTVRFRDRWRVRSRDRIVHAEDQAIEGDAVTILSRTATAGGHAAMATILLIGPDAPDRLNAARSLVGKFAGLRAGASAWEIDGTGKLLARLIAKDGYDLRKALLPLLRLLNDGATLPKVWSL